MPAAEPQSATHPASPRIPPRVLSIAGTDPTGGAGIQADLKSIAANGGYGMAVVTALVAQNTHGVRSVHTPPRAFLREQLDAVSDDVEIDAVKIGMLGDAATIAVVREWLERVSPVIVVLDPVMISTSGHRLLDAEAEEALRELLPLADVVTPNIPELAALAGSGTAPAGTWPELLAQGLDLAGSSGTIVLAKGGHLGGAASPDALLDTRGRIPGGRFEVQSERVDTRNTHGTGCSLSSALATRQAQLGDWTEALTVTKRWLTESLRHADDLHVGTGNGPINHFHTLWSTGGLE
ncbi:MAG: hydroxymethylpyrimidine/phosphomethylpyrimidine kinase [Subtercola sp.]|nr:hydroxymethylpyrimidine/phosphomethylpyrimidine kinase [Subtercola sp.]